MTDRRFPPPWSVVEHPESFVVTDAKGQALAYVYFEDEDGRRRTMKRLTSTPLRRLSHAADHGASSVADVYVLDANVLMTAVAQASKDFHLQCERPHQTSRSRAEGSNPPLRPESAIQLRENRHRRYVYAGQLDCECCLKFISRSHSFYHGDGGIDVKFRNSAIG
jgi:hypothetical protein